MVSMALPPFAFVAATTSISTLRVFGKRGHLYRGLRWRIRFEIGAIKFVYRLEVGEIGEENGRLDDVSEIQSLRPEHSYPWHTHARSRRGARSRNAGRER